MFQAFRAPIFTAQGASLIISSASSLLRSLIHCFQGFDEGSNTGDAARVLAPPESPQRCPGRPFAPVSFWPGSGDAVQVPAPPGSLQRCPGWPFSPSGVDSPWPGSGDAARVLAPLESPQRCPGWPSFWLSTPRPSSRVPAAMSRLALRWRDLHNFFLKPHSGIGP